MGLRIDQMVQSISNMYPPSYSPNPVGDMLGLPNHGPCFSFAPISVCTTCQEIRNGSFKMQLPGDKWTRFAMGPKSEHGLRWVASLCKGVLL